MWDPLYLASLWSWGQLGFCGVSLEDTQGGDKVTWLLLLILSLSSSQRCSGQSHKSPISMLELAEPWEIHCTEMQHLPF